jgi:hypothetical protein
MSDLSVSQIKRDSLPDEPRPDCVPAPAWVLAARQAEATAVLPQPAGLKAGAHPVGDGSMKACPVPQWAVAAVQQRNRWLEAAQNQVLTELDTPRGVNREIVCLGDQD